MSRIVYRAFAVKAESDLAAQKAQETRIHRGQHFVSTSRKLEAGKSGKVKMVYRCTEADNTAP